MRISTKGRYSLEALLYIALTDSPGHINTRTIAAHTGLPDGYLEQLFIPLRRANILKGVRGPQGGYALAREPESISAGEILRAAEGSLKPVDCVGNTACPVRQECLSRSTWEELHNAINACVDSITLRDMTRVYESMDTGEYAI